MPVNLDILLASLVSFLTSLIFGSAAMLDWGWRVPFFAGAAMDVVAFCRRRSLREPLGAEERVTALEPGNTAW